MAAPIVAGTAALLRQYFKEGYYAQALRKRGQCHAPYLCQAFEPSSPLMKAIFVISAVPVTALRVDHTVTPLFSPPDLIQGHGRVKIDNVLDFSGQFSSYLIDKQFVESGQSRRYYFQVSESTVPLQFCLAWIDPPNSFTAQKQLLHDLDLIVVDQNGNIYYPNGLPGPDERNNIEKVVIHEPRTGK